jgi:hypothetical protein
MAAADAERRGDEEMHRNHAHLAIEQGQRDDHHAGGEANIQRISRR